MNMRKQSWQQVATHERALLLAKIPAGLRLPQDYLDVVTSHGRLLDIPRQCGLLSPMEVDITESDATILVTKLTRAQISSVAVTTAFCKRAAIAHQLVSMPNLFLYQKLNTRLGQLSDGDHVR
jgi:amidase